MLFVDEYIGVPHFTCELRFTIVIYLVDKLVQTEIIYRIYQIIDSYLTIVDWAVESNWGVVLSDKSDKWQLWLSCDWCWSLMISLMQTEWQHRRLTMALGMQVLRSQIWIRDTSLFLRRAGGCSSERHGGGGFGFEGGFVEPFKPPLNPPLQICDRFSRVFGIVTETKKNRVYPDYNMASFLVSFCLSFAIYFIKIDGKNDAEIDLWRFEVWPKAHILFIAQSIQGRPGMQTFSMKIEEQLICVRAGLCCLSWNRVSDVD